MTSFGSSALLSDFDTLYVRDWISNSTQTLIEVNPDDVTQKGQLLRISEIYKKLLPMVGKSIRYINAVQERKRGAELHEMICKQLGYGIYKDNGTYPDIANQLLEVKLQTSPTIDLGLHSPTDGEAIEIAEDAIFHSEDVRYVIFEDNVQGEQVYLENLYLFTGEDFPEYFPLFKGEGKNAKLQLPLPSDFFD